MHYAIRSKSKKERKGMKAYLNMKGFENYMEKLVKLGGDIDSAAIECLEVGQEIQYEEMKKGLERHKDTGEALAALVKEPIQSDGSYHSVKTGTSIDANQAGFFHGIYQEYGSPTTKIDPWFRPAVDGTKRKIRAVWKQIFKAKGVDIS